MNKLQKTETRLYDNVARQKHPSLLVILTCLVLAVASTSARAIDPVSASAIAETATGVLKELPSAVSWVGSKVRKSRSGSGSVAQIIDIIPTANNSAFIDVNGSCGYFMRTKIGRRYVREVTLYYFDKEIGKRTYGNSGAERSRIMRLTVNNIVPRADVEAALRAGKRSLDITIRAKVKCDTYNERRKHFRGKRSAYPTDTVRLSLKLPEVKTAKAPKKESNKATRKNPKKNNKTIKKNPKKNNKVHKPKASFAPNLQVKVTNQNALNKVRECPRFVHFTGMIKFNAPGTYSYFFDAKDGSRTKAKKVVTNASGKKEFYWNRRIKLGSKKASSLFKGWTRINVRFKPKNGPRKLFKSKPVRFTTKCS